MRWVITPFLCIGAMLVSACAQGADSNASGCMAVTFQAVPFVVCRYDAQQYDIRTVLNDDEGQPYLNFANVADAVVGQGKALVFAMNGGMYHDDRSAVGLYIENTKKLSPLNTNEGPGNFHMMPNGVFLIWQEDGLYGAHVLTSQQFTDNMAKDVVTYATQSGPMLVIGGELHPKFKEGSKSRHIRNGVGVAGGDVVFAISEEPVNFYTFAKLFQEHLSIDNALYLDGAVSKIYAPELQRHDVGRAMGPMIVVLDEKANK